MPPMPAPSPMIGSSSSTCLSMSRAAIADSRAQRPMWMRSWHLLREHKPHQIYATGDAADPSSVAGICFKVLEAALKACEGEEWVGTCSLWLYRGKEKALEGPRDRHGHTAQPHAARTQSSRAFPLRFPVIAGTQRRQSPIARTPRNYDALGLAEYEAIETFQKLASCLVQAQACASK
jgi:hypothetical protein